MYLFGSCVAGPPKSQKRKRAKEQRVKHNQQCTVFKVHPCCSIRVTWVRDSQAPCAEDLLPRILAGVVEPLGAIVTVLRPLNRLYEGLLTFDICATLIRGLNDRAT